MESGANNIEQKLLNLRLRMTELEQLRAQSLSQMSATRFFPVSTHNALEPDAAYHLNLALNLLARQLKSLVGYTTIAFYFPANNCWQLLSDQDLADNQQVEKLHLGLSHFLTEITDVSEPILQNSVFQALAAQNVLEKLPNGFKDLIVNEANSWLCVPLQIKNELTFWVSLTYNQPEHFTQRHIKLITVTYNQLITAYNRLYDRAQTQAVQEERQRIARELHDSVTQVFYGIELAANAARTLLRRQDPDRVAGQLDEILHLAEAGLAEMRALLLELRPEALAAEGLVVALYKQTAALKARHNLDITTDFGDEPPISLEAKEVFYRIAGEALQNVVKHAHATAVQVSLKSDADFISLVIKDDGLGFDPKISHAGHFGLTSMRERAARVGATLELQSQLGFGTQVHLHLLTPQNSPQTLL